MMTDRTENNLSVFLLPGQKVTFRQCHRISESCDHRQWPRRLIRSTHEHWSNPILGTFPLNSGRFPQIVHSGCIFAETAGVLLKSRPGFEAKMPDRDDPPSGQMTWSVWFPANRRKNIANYLGILTLNPFTNAKRITHALYQNMGDLVANPVDIDTVDDTPNRVQRLVHCTRIIEHITKVAEIKASVHMPSWNTRHRIKRKLNIQVDCVNYRSQTWTQGSNS